MMSIYDDHPHEIIVAILDTTNRVVGCPESQVPRFRDSQGHAIKSAPWTQLRPYDMVKQTAEEVLALRRTREAAAAVEERRRLRDAAIQSWWDEVRTIPGGEDPMWQYGTDTDDPVKALDDKRYAVRDARAGSPPWFPRMRLRARYGTASLREFAQRNGVPYPET